MSGFTLVEMMIAVAISTMLVGGIYSALVSTQRIAADQAVDSGKDAARMRAVEVLRADLRHRISLKTETGAEEASSFTLSTTSDSVTCGEMKRSIPEVRYVASPKGLKRTEEKGTEIELATGAVTVEYWENSAWRKQATQSPQAIRLTFVQPAEKVVIR